MTQPKHTPGPFELDHATENGTRYFIVSARPAMTDWLKLAADICLSPYSDVASLESASSVGDTRVIVATVAPEFSEFAPQGASQGVSSTVEGHGTRVALVEDSGFPVQQNSGYRQIAPSCAPRVGSNNETSEYQASPADSQGLTRGVDIRSSSAPIEFDDCLYCNQLTLHCQAHARCLSCGEGCRECAVSGLSSPTIFMTHPPLSSRSREREGSSMEESLPAEMVRYDLAPEHKGEIATRESLESEGAAAIASNGDCGFVRGVQNGLTARRDEQQIQTPAGILTFDEEYGRTYRGRLFTGNTIEDLLGAVMRAEQGARR